MKKTVTREITINECDFCSEEMKNFNRCALCKKEMCLKHTTFSIEIFCYEGRGRLAGFGSHICNDCSDNPIQQGTTLKFLFNQMITNKKHG